MLKNKFTFLIIILIVSFVFQSNSCNKNDSSNPVNPEGTKLTYIGGYKTNGDSRGIALNKINNIPYGYIADGSNGLQILNLTNIYSPTLEGAYNTVGFSYEVVVAPVNNVNYAFVSDGAGGLVIININNPSTPSLDTILHFTDEEIVTAAVSGNYLFAGGFSGKVYIFDLSGLPSNVNYLATYTTTDNINHIEISNGTAFIVKLNLGLEIINITNPFLPTFMSTIDTPGDSYDVKIGSHYAFIADGDAGLTIIDITYLNNPVYITTKQTNGKNMGVCFANIVTQPQIYTAEYSYGVEAFDISGITNLRALEYYSTGNYAYDIVYYAGMIYVAAGPQGIEILKYE